MTTKIPTLPVIDISPFLSSTSQLESLQSTSQEIHEACINTGFFYLTGHGIPPNLMVDILRVVRSFLVEGSDREKDQLSILKNDRARGYQRTGDNLTMGKTDWHEAIDLYASSPYDDENPVDQQLADDDQPQTLTRVLGGKNRFPSHPIDFKVVVDDWIQRMCTLGEIVMRATAMGLKMSLDETEGLLDQVRDSFWVLRCIGYPPLPSTHDGISCGAHKDYGCFTFLHADDTRGSLQVFAPSKTNENKTDYHWIEANPIPGAFVVNIGEMWETWTNGLYKATLHRVIHRGSNYRVSVPFFYEPAFNAVVAPLPAALKLQELQENKPVQVVKQPIKYGDFLLSKVSGNFSISGGPTRDRY